MSHGRALWVRPAEPHRDPSGGSASLGLLLVTDAATSGVDTDGLPCYIAPSLAVLSRMSDTA